MEWDKTRYRTIDRLTGLATVDSFYEEAKRILEDKHAQKNWVFVYFDVAHFKTLNSEYGFEVGDDFLQNLANVLSDTFCGDLVGRTSNDHFIALTNGENVEKRIMRVREKTHRIQIDMKMDLRAGIYYYEDGVSVALAHDRAKTACDALRGNSNQIFRYYDKALRDEMLHEKYIVDHLDKAIENEHLVVYYQPIRRVFNNKICAMESLVRWNDPKLGLLSPAEFIPILENRHLIHKLDTYMVERVCKDMMTAKQLGQTIVPVSVNFSRLDFRLMDVYKMLTDTLEKYHVQHQMIHVEITESALNKEEESLIATIAKLRESGFEIWLDDFGSEYSTLNVLQNYQFDLLKIDMNFFANFDKNEKAKTIIVSIVDMAKRLHMRVLAEGIETKEQYEFLGQIGCDKAQGYYICRPTTLDLLLGSTAEVETEEEAAYFAAIGKVNFLSPNPLEDYADAAKIYNVIPTAIVQYENKNFEYLFANQGYKDALKEIGIDSEEASKDFLNSSTANMKTRLESLLQKSHENQQMESMDLVFRGQHVNIKAREIAGNETMQALFLTLTNLSTMEYARKIDRLETSLNFLYSIYERVDFIDVVEDKIENIYLSSQEYRTMFHEKSLKNAIEDYAKLYVAVEDKKKFLDFYDFSTLDERLDKSEKGYIVCAIRATTHEDGVQPQLYAIIRVNDGRAVKFLSCVRNMIEVESEESGDSSGPAPTKESQWYQILSNEMHVSILDWNLKSGESFTSGRAYQYVLCRDDMDKILQNNGNMEAIYPEDIPMALRFFEESKSGQKRAEVTLRLKMIDGSYRWSKIIGRFYHDSESKEDHVIGIILDVEQEQKNLQQAKFLNLMPTALGVFEVQNGVTRQLFMNDGYFRLVEDEREHRARYAKNFLNGIHPDDRKYVHQAMESVIAGKQECTDVCRVLTGSGTYKWIRFSSSVAKRENNYLLVYSTYVEIGQKMVDKLNRTTSDNK